MTGDKSHKGVSSLCSNLFRYWLLRYLSELSKRQRIDGDYLPPFAAKLKNKGQLLRKGWGTRRLNSFRSYYFSEPEPVKMGE
jgi:hypothetical protein